MMATRIRIAEAEILSWVDGDTVDTALDIGWGIVLIPRHREGNPGPARIRVVGANGVRFDAPELGSERGEAAHRAAGVLLPVGTRKVQVVSFGLDSFGRTLGALTLVDGRDFGGAMTKLGHIKGVATNE